MAAACLIVYWHAKNKDMTGEVQTALRDLVFEARALGKGSSFACAKLKLLDKEEQDRHVLGMSAFRKCLFLVDMHNQLTTEGLYKEIKSDAEAMMRLLRDEHVALNNWSADTVRRYLVIGRRIMACPTMREFSRGGKAWRNAMRCWTVSRCSGLWCKRPMPTTRTSATSPMCCSWSSVPASAMPGLEQVQPRAGRVDEIIACPTQRAHGRLIP